MILLFTLTPLHSTQVDATLLVLEMKKKQLLSTPIDIHKYSIHTIGDDFL